MLNMGVAPQDLGRKSKDYFQVILNEQGNRAFVTDPTKLPDAVRGALPFPVMSTAILSDAQELADQITSTLKFELWQADGTAYFRPVFNPNAAQIRDFERYRRRGTFSVSPKYVVPQRATFVQTFSTYQDARNVADSMGWDYKDL